MKLPWKQIVVVFVLGAVVGFAATRCVGRHRIHSWGKGKHFQERMLKQFNAKLNLTPGQSTQVAAIFEAKRQKIDALQTEMRPKFEEVRSSTRTEIRQLLSPEQQQKFDAMNAARKAKTKRFRKRWSDGP